MGGGILALHLEIRTYKSSYLQVPMLCLVLEVARLALQKGTRYSMKSCLATGVRCRVHFGTIHTMTCVHHEEYQKALSEYSDIHACLQSLNKIKITLKSLLRRA